MLAFLLSGDDEPAGDVAQAELLRAQVQGDRDHGVVGDGGAEAIASVGEVPDDELLDRAATESGTD